MIAINTHWKHKKLGYPARVIESNMRSVKYERASIEHIPDNRYKCGTREVKRDAAEFRLSEVDFLTTYEPV